MVRADVFDMVAMALSRFGPKPGTPFGGVQIVLVGDLYQLPPVVSEGEAAFFSTTYETRTSSRRTASAVTTSPPSR